MDRKRMLKTILLEYISKIEHIKSIQNSFSCSKAILKRKRQLDLLVLKKLRDQQHLLLMALAENVSQRIWKANPASNFWEVCYNCNDDAFFKSHFRMSRANFDILCGFMGNLKKSDTNWRKAISLPNRVAIALRTLASDGEYREVCELFGIGKSTVCEILIEFCKEVWSSMYHEYIKKFPLTQPIIYECVNGFKKLGLPQCLGAIGGCHVKVRPKPQDSSHYLNYNGWHSMILLALVDYRQRFLYIHVGSPGQCNYSDIYESSNLKKQLDETFLITDNVMQMNDVDVPIFIIGGTAFKSSKNLMTPYISDEDLTEEQKFYNDKLSKPMSVLDTAFTHLKARFQRVGKGLDNRVGNTPLIVRACCVLHNFLNENNDPINDQWLYELTELERSRQFENNNVPTNDDVNSSAEVMRQALTKYLFSVGDNYIDNILVVNTATDNSTDKDSNFYKAENFGVASSSTDSGETEEEILFDVATDEKDFVIKTADENVVDPLAGKIEVVHNTVGIEDDVKHITVDDAADWSIRDIYEILEFLD